MIPHKQLSLNEILGKCEEKLENDKPTFLKLLGNAIDFDTLVAPSFYFYFHRGVGRSRKYPLDGFLWAMLIQRIFSIPTVSILILFLKYSQDLREFCGFTKVPDASKFTRFKEDFLPNLQLLFDHLVELTEPICQALDAEKASMTIFDTSGIEAFVTENNPKYANRIINTIHTRLPMVLCRLMPPQILSFSRCISTDTFATRSNLALSPTGLVLCATSVFTTKIF